MEEEERERERELNTHECQAWISKRWLTYNDLYVNPSPVQIKASVWSQHVPTTYVVHPLLNSNQTMISRGISGYPIYIYVIGLYHLIPMVLNHNSPGTT